MSKWYKIPFKDSSAKSTSSARRLIKGLGKKAKKATLLAKGIPVEKIRTNLHYCAEIIAPLWQKINDEILVIKNFYEVIF